MRCSRHGKPIACHRARQCIAHGMPKQGVAKAWQASCWVPSRRVTLGIDNQVAGCSNSKFMKQSCDAQKKGHCSFSDIIMFLPATRAKAKFATIGGGGLPPLGKPWPPDAGCHGTLLSRPLGQFLAFWPWLLVETRPVGNARKKDQNAPETKCYFKPSRKAEHGSIGQSKTLSGNSWPFGL
ncbi:hypothetical protein RHGRI_030603 [Rhododendron griersonianum]|uniref:Uncharacterized protein n=1 Tax=Rhododendron griersonianum TaxID=479676 RepID=A0AAV6I4R7_9ERIC|nr:hypothetical protein RHGRI_030603 [Rhododendron griersonianum]